MSRRFLGIALLLISISGCTSESTNLVNLRQFDKNTKYEVAKMSGTFDLRVSYIRHQFVPDYPTLASECRTQTVNVAKAYAAENGLMIEEITPLRVNAGTTRNILSGETSCEATLTVKILG